MKEKLTIDDFKSMLECALKNIREREEEFSKLDAVIGDGDHGQAIVSAMLVLVETARRGTEFKTMFNDMGFDVMLQVSGSTSTLLGAFFMGMGDAVSGTEMDAQGVRNMFKAGLDNVKKQTQAKPGDKTMMDALVPAVDAICECVSSDISDLLKAGAEAAVIGAESTILMRANFGRARNYGERSIGFADSGAASWSCMFQSFSEGIR